LQGLFGSHLLGSGAEGLGSRSWSTAIVRTRETNGASPVSGERRTD
jgi:hypothetical protein